MALGAGPGRLSSVGEHGARLLLRALGAQWERAWVGVGRDRRVAVRDPSELAEPCPHPTAAQPPYCEGAREAPLEGPWVGPSGQAPPSAPTPGIRGG